MHTYLDSFLPVSWEDMDTAAAQLTHTFAQPGQLGFIGVQARRPRLLPSRERALRDALPEAQRRRRQPRPEASRREVGH